VDWILEIIKKYTDGNGKVDLEKANKEIKEEAPKNVMPKKEYNDKVAELKTANNTIETLKTENKDVETLQTKISDYETEVKDLKEQRRKERAENKIKEKLKESKAKDVDYMLYKLGKYELDDEGNVIELDNKIKSLTENNPGHFESDETNDNPEGNKKVVITRPANKQKDDNTESLGQRLARKAREANGIVDKKEEK